jgi:hypothetical protein
MVTSAPVLIRIPRFTRNPDLPRTTAPPLSHTPVHTPTHRR